MRFSIRVDSMTFCALMGATLALLMLLDIQSLRQTAPRRANMANTVQERVVTKEFVLTDESGNKRVRIGLNELDAPALSLYDKSGTERALLRLNRDDVPSLRLFDENGTMREGMGFAQGSMEPHLWFFDANGGTSELLPAGNSNNGIRLNYLSSGSIRLNYLNHSIDARYYDMGTKDSSILWNVPADVNGIGPNAR